ncbi:hypothetical protein EMIT0P12_10585 [Pseudomonas sp. IT-P12]
MCFKEVLVGGSLIKLKLWMSRTHAMRCTADSMIF